MQHKRDTADTKAGESPAGEKPADQVIEVPLFRDGFDDGVAEGVRRERRRYGRPPTDRQLIEALRRKLRAELREPEPTQQASTALVQSWSEAKGLTARFIGEHVVAPVHRELWDKSPRRRRR
jgi:hypothetical protein